MKSTILKINKRIVSQEKPTYFIADIAANHDGSLQKAIDLIFMAKEAGADAAKFQHFKAETIVSKKTFDNMNNKLSHQRKWSKSVFEVYKAASIKWDWTEKLVKACKKANIDFFTAPYDFDYIDRINKYVPAYKIGSGDITWNDALIRIAKKKKPIFLATGASSIEDVKRAFKIITKINNKICIMQCNTNYTGKMENLKFVNLNVLKQFKKIFPKAILGLSDHTPGHSSVLGAITLGARVIEKHFTYSNKVDGPDHFFSMNPKSWKEMIERSRELELALGSNKKKVENNEKETVMVQRRSAHLLKNLKKDEKIKKKYLTFLRPALNGSVKPYELNKVVKYKIKKNKSVGDILLWKDLK
tara:strand:+ start:907 stop:1980 length:1074 start_codon:yes stop_codon:yes gene_type:complete